MSCFQLPSSHTEPTPSEAYITSPILVLCPYCPLAVMNSLEVLRPVIGASRLGERNIDRIS